MVYCRDVRSVPQVDKTRRWEPYTYPNCVYWFEWGLETWFQAPKVRGQFPSEAAEQVTTSKRFWEWC